MGYGGGGGVETCSREQQGIGGKGVTCGDRKCDKK